MSIRFKWTLFVVISITVVLVINNLYMSFQLTGISLALYKDPLILFLSIATLVIVSWMVYLLTGMYSGRINQIRLVLGKLLNHQAIHFPKITNDEIGAVMNEIEQLSVTLLENEQEIQKQQEALKKLAYTDSLTNLPNREHILTILKAKEQNEEQLLILSVVLTRTDIVHALKGPGVYDAIILEAKERIMSYLPSDTIVGRMSNNQFCILLPLSSNVDKNQILEKSKSIQQVLEWPYFIQDDKYYIHSYIGISVRHPDDKTSLLELVHLADLAVVERKEEIAPNLYLFHHPLRDEQESLHLFEVALRSAIRNKELQVVYQPIVSLDEYTLSLETLVRWKYKDQWITPKEFIPLVEELGLMEEMTLHVIEQAAKDWGEWKTRIPELSHVSINISPSLVKCSIGNRMIQSLLTILDRYHLTPKNLCLELTENVFLEESTFHFIEKCNQLGFILAVDDFGTGYSSMSYLAQYSFDVLKIDRAFIIKIEFESKQKEVAYSIVQLAKRLNIRVVAEGVETKEQLLILQEMGVHAIQGYYFSKPQFLNEWNPTMFEEKRNSVLKVVS